MIARDKRSGMATGGASPLRPAGMLVIAFALASCGNVNEGPSPGGAQPPGMQFAGSPRAGTLDGAFGVRGVETTAVGPGGNDVAYALIQQTADHKLVAAGFSFDGAQNRFAVARYTTSGTLDLAFGTNGKVTTPIGAKDDKAHALALQSDGKLVAAGSTNDGTQNRFALARYTTAGALDGAFGTGGLVTTPIGAKDDEAFALALQSDGKLVAAGFTNDGVQNKFALVHYNADGALDATGFGTGGKVTTPIGAKDDKAYALALQPDGKLVAAGYTDDGTQKRFALVRYNADGSLDATGFGSGGIVTTAIGAKDDEAFALAIQTDGKLVAAGYTDDGTQKRFALARYTTAGVPDGTFGTGGIVTTAVGTTDDQIHGLALQSDGKPVVAGYSFDGSQYLFALARYTTNGALDASFGRIGGTVTTPVGSTEDEAYALIVQTDGKLVAAGRSIVSGQSQFALARYW